MIEKMLHPDPAQRLTLARVRKHPWAAPAVAEVYQAIAEPKDCSLLISDDPSKDLYDGALRKVRVVTRCRVGRPVSARVRVVLRPSGG